MPNCVKFEIMICLLKQQSKTGCVWNLHSFFNKCQMFPVLVSWEILLPVWTGLYFNGQTLNEWLRQLVIMMGCAVAAFGRIKFVNEESQWEAKWEAIKTGVLLRTDEKYLNKKGIFKVVEISNFLLVSKIGYLHDAFIVGGGKLPTHVL